MRARELRDVVEVLILPTLDRALEELTSKNGSKRRARLLVQLSVNQLSGMMAPSEPTVEEQYRAAAAPFGKPADQPEYGTGVTTPSHRTE